MERRQKTRRELKPVPGVTVKAGLLVVAPDRFGQQGAVLAQAEGEMEPARLAAWLDEALRRFQPTQKDPFQHIGEGRQQGVYWQTTIPVTDPGPPGGRPPGFGGPPPGFGPRPPRP